MTPDDRAERATLGRVPWPLVLVLIVMGVGLVVSIVLVSVQSRRAQEQAAMTNRRLEALEGFIAERGEVRDQQYTTLDERITSAVCDLLDQLPATPVLDPVRDQYGCGPGLPMEALSPEARQQLQWRGAPEVVPAHPAPAVRPAQPAPGTTDAPTPTPTVAPRSVAPVQPTKPSTVGAAPAAPAPAPTTPPLVDLNPITQPVCDALGLCL